MTVHDAPQTLAEAWVLLIDGNPEFAAGSGQAMFYVGAHVILKWFAEAHDPAEREALMERLRVEIDDWTGSKRHRP